MKFVFESPPPSRDQLQRSGVFTDDNQLDVSGICVSAEYRDQEFYRVGYYYRLEYDDPALQENPPQPVDWSRLRVVLNDDPHITRWSIKWDPTPSVGDAASVGTEEPSPKRPCV